MPKSRPINFDNRDVEGIPSLRRGIYGQPASDHQGHSGRHTERSALKQSVVELFGSDDYGQENHPIPNGRPEMLQEDRYRSKEGSSVPSPEHMGTRALDSGCPGPRPLSALTSHSNKSQASSVEAGLADLVSFVPYLDRASEWTDEDNANKSIPQAGSNTDLGHDTPPHDVRRGENHIPDGVNAEFRGDGRPLAVPAMRTSQITKGFGASRSSSDSKVTSRSGTAGKLRTKTSIPLLVKSPRPLTAVSRSESDANSPVIRHSLAHLGRGEMGACDIRQNSQTEPTDTASPAFPCDAGSQVRPPDHTTSPIPERESSGDYHSLRPSNGRLKLRVSRAALTKTYTRSHPNRGQGDTPKPSETSASVDPQGCRNQDEGNIDLLEKYDQRPSSAEEPKAPSHNGPAVLGNFRTSLSGRISTSIQPGRGLKKRVSELCVRLGGSSIQSSKGEGSSSDTESFPRLIRDTIQEKMEGDPSQPNAFPRQLGRFRGRGSRWLRAARHAVMVACAGSRKR
ncbi:hypothetical protein QBC39DRAFT_340652 [Podospora conica]|nr:hypothetical protein QBC39DRAFT_340652 [Schizothecium conicum]